MELPRGKINNLGSLIQGCTFKGIGLQCESSLFHVIKGKKIENAFDDSVLRFKKTIIDKTALKDFWYLDEKGKNKSKNKCYENILKTRENPKYWKEELEEELRE